MTYPTQRSGHQLSLRSLKSDELERSLRAVLGSVGYGILLTDLNHQALMCNGRFGEIFGVDPAAVVAGNVEEVRSMVRSRIADPTLWVKNLEKIYADALAEQNDELRLNSPNCVLARNTRPVLDEYGEVVGRLWTFWDVTSESRQKDLDRALAAIASHTPGDPAIVSQFIATTVAEVFGSTAIISVLQEPVGGEGYLAFHSLGGVPDGAPEIAGNQISNSFCQYCLADGKETFVQDARTNSEMAHLLPVQLGFTRYAGVPLRGSLGEFVGTLCILDARSDEVISEAEFRFLSLVGLRVESELMREQHIAFLEQDLSLMGERVTSLQTQLIQSEKLAVTGTLAASVAHDIRNILASLQLQIEIGRTQPTVALDYVENSLSRFSVLAHRLMSYARPTEQALEHVDLNEIVVNVALLVQPQFAVSKVELSLEMSDSSEFVLGDAGRLEHMFVNLLINALNVSGPDSVVHLRVSKGLVEVSDSGPGVDPAILDSLFEPFVTQRKDGIGLGLFSCREIAKDLGAEITVHPRTEGGTTFIVQFRGQS